MDSLVYKRITSKEDISNLYILANSIWHEYFPCILDEEQINYMVEMFFSNKAINASIKNGYLFYFVKHNRETIGFIAVHPEKEKLFLSKLYLTKDNRGKGYGSDMLNFVKSIAKEQSLPKIYLTVNKHNTHTIDVYKHYGFVIESSEQFNIGKGYIMDDYVMEYTL